MGRYDAYINSSTWRQKRALAFSVYGRRCSRCPATTRLHVHHKTYDRFGDELVADLEILCESCHMLEHGHVPKQKNNDPQIKFVRGRRLANRQNRRYEQSSPLSQENVEWLSGIRARLGRA